VFEKKKKKGFFMKQKEIKRTGQAAPAAAVSTKAGS